MSGWSSDYPFLLALVTHRSKELVPAPDRLRQFAKENKKAPVGTFSSPSPAPGRSSLGWQVQSTLGHHFRGATPLLTPQVACCPRLQRASFLLPSDCLLFLSVSPETRQNEDWLVFPLLTPSTPHLFLYLASLPLTRGRWYKAPAETGLQFKPSKP